MAGEVPGLDLVPPAAPAEPIDINPYRQVAVDLDRLEGQRAKTNLVAAKGTTPDATARALPIAKRLNVPVDVVERNLADFETIAKSDEYAGLLRGSPMLKRWLGDPVNARLAGEDLPKLAGTESLWRGLMDTLVRAPAEGAVGFVGSTLAGLGEGYNVLARTAQRAVDALGIKSPTADMPMPWFLDPAQILKRPGTTIKGYAQDIGVPAERENLADQIVGGVGQIAAQMAAIVGTGGGAGLLMLFGQGVDQMEAEVAKSGKAGTGAADMALVSGGAVTAIAEKLGLDLLMNRLPPAIKNKFLRVASDLVLSAGIEAAEEAVEKMGQNVLSNYYLETNKALLEGVVDEALPAGGSAALVRAMLLGAGRVGRGKAKAPLVAEQDTQKLDELYASVRESVLGQKAPDKMAELLAQSGADQSVFVPASAVRAYFQSLDPEEADRQARAVGIEGQLNEALAIGGDVVIPLHQYVAHAPEDMAAAWRDDLRLRSGGMSVNETKAFEASDAGKALGEKVAGRLEETTKANKARDVVVAQVERQLQDAGESPEAARQLAQLYGERYATRAARLGRGDAVSAYAASGVQFRSDLPEALKFAPADDLELLVRALKGRTDRSETEAAGPTILQAISRGGGIIDDAGELTARDVDKWHIGRPWQRKALREAPQSAGGGFPGLTEGAGDRSRYGMDAWALRLWEEGYFPEFDERPSIDDLLAALDEEMRGKPRRLEKAGKGWVADFDMAVRDLDEVLTKAGVDSRKATVEEIRAALEAMNQQDGQSYEQQIETDAFKAWFGESVVVDGSGRPLVVYHGTSDDVAAFDLDHPNRKDSGWLGTGVYATSDPVLAGSYARLKHGAAAPNIMPLFARLVNPYYATLKEKQRFMLLSHGRGGAEAGRAAADAWTAELKAKGHDGVILQYDPKDVGEANASMEIVVFDPAGVKSATGNRGTFDPNDPRVYNQGAVAPPFYSGVGRAIEQSKLKKGTAEQWMGTLRNAGGVKAEELKWLGLEEWLKEQEGAVSREAMLEFVQANQIKITEVVRGGLAKKLRDPRQAPDYQAMLARGFRAEILENGGKVGEGDLDGVVALAGSGQLEQPVHAVDLTPELKKAALEQGFSLFQKSHGQITFSQNSSGEQLSLITLFKDRNLSTVIHETGHLWLEELLADAGAASAPEQLKADAALARAYLGIPEGGLPTEAQHETWARTVEAYMMEGKSPSVALSPVLARFKAWMVSIYRSILKLNAPISDEVRGVLDRMIATDEAIEEAKTEIGARQLFASADQAGMTEAEFTAYSNAIHRSRDRAEFQVLDRLMDDIRRERTAEWKAETDAIRAEVRPLVESQPDMVALAYLRSGALPDSLAHLRGLPRMKLSRDAVIEEYGNPEIVNALPRSVPPLVTDRGGVRPGEIAEMLGFTDGRSMVDALTALAKEQAAMKAAGDKRSVRVKRIDEEVGRVMKKRHGDMLTDGSIEAEALSALHNEARGEVLATEVRQLARTAGKEATPLRLAREWAKRAIAEKQVGDVADLSQYTRAELRASRLAEQALAKGDHDEALRRKQEQMIAHALWMEARDAKAEVEKARKMMDRLAVARTLKSMDQEYLEKIHDLLERFDLKARSLRAVERSESLRTWADKQQALGVDVAVPEKLLEEAYRTSYRRLSIEEFRGLADSVRQLAHLGRKKQEFLDGKDKREFDALVDEAVGLAGRGRQSGDASTDAGKTNFQRRFGAVVSKLRSADSALLKVEYLFRWLDGGKTAGPFTRLFQRMSAAQAGEKTQWGKLGTALHGLFHEIPVETRRRMQDIAVYPELNGETLRRDALVAVALNMGNEGNKAKMLKGHGWTEEGVLAAINRGLGAEEMAFVQKTWDLIETLWPDIAAMERRVNGVEPEKVDATELVTKHGTFRGGYYPLVYEPKREAQAGDPDMGLSVEDFGSPIYTRATTPKGFTKERSEGFARPIHLSLEVIPQHLMEVVHDLHWREAIMDGQRFLSDPRIVNAIRSKLGREYQGQLQPWLNHMAMEYAKDRQGMAGWDQAMKTLRTNMTLVGMGYRLTTIFSQIGGFADSTAELGARWMASGAVSYATHPIDSIAFVRSRSGEMQHRADNLDRDIRKVSKQMAGKDGLLDPVRDFAFKGVAWADAAVTIPTWLGAYNKAQHEGKSEREAIEYADQMVRHSQGSSGSKDLVRLQTSGEAGKLITMFYSYFSHYYNAQRDVGRRLVDARTPADFGDALARAFWLNGPGVLAAQLFAGQGPDEEKESWAAWAARTMFFNLFMGIPVVRDLASTTSNAVAGKFVGGYQLSPISRVFETGGRVASDAWKVATGEEPSDKAVSHVINLTGYMTALPTGQVATTSQFLYDALWSKSANPQGVGDWMKGLVYGPPSKK